MYDLQRFLTAQEKAYPYALAEMKAGRKRSHWIWYIFPQLIGLGESYNSRYYGILSLEEARAYLAHPVLGQRLCEITEALLTHRESSPLTVMSSSIDVVKLQASMTLFSLAAEDSTLFDEVLTVFYGGKKHKATLDRLSPT